ncbi:hypothetical protein EV122DRAFT_282211 [Schizophyllum commune]
MKTEPAFDATASVPPHRQSCVLLQAGMGDELAEDTETEPGSTDEDDDSARPLEAHPLEVMRVIFKPHSLSIPEATRQPWPANSYAKRILDTLAAVGVEYAGNHPADQLPILLKLRRDIPSTHDYMRRLFPSARSFARYEQMRAGDNNTHQYRNAFQGEHNELLTAASSLTQDLRDAVGAGNSGRSSNLLDMKEVIRGLQDVISSMLSLIDAEVDARKGIKHKLRENGAVVFEGIPL